MFSIKQVFNIHNPLGLDLVCSCILKRKNYLQNMGLYFMYWTVWSHLFNSRNNFELQRIISFSMLRFRCKFLLKFRKPIFRVFIKKKLNNNHLTYKEPYNTQFSFKIVLIFKHYLDTNNLKESQCSNFRTFINI
jgi:hypothetical protein